MNLPFFFLPVSALEALPLPRVTFSVLGMLEELLFGDDLFGDQKRS